MIFNLLSGTAEEHQCHGEPRRRTVLTNTLKNKNENPFCIWAKKKFIFKKYILRIGICAMENVAGTCMVAAGAMQYWSGVARAASLQATSSQHPSKLFPHRRLHPPVAEFLVMSRKFCGISFGFRTESSGVWRCAGYCVGGSSDPLTVVGVGGLGRTLATVRWVLLSPSVRAGQLTIQLTAVASTASKVLPWAANWSGSKSFLVPEQRPRLAGESFIFLHWAVMDTVSGYWEQVKEIKKSHQESGRFDFLSRQIWSDEATKSDQLK